MRPGGWPRGGPIGDGKGTDARVALALPFPARPGSSAVLDRVVDAI